MFPPLPYRPFATRTVLRSVVIWFGLHAVAAGAGGWVLEWQAAAVLVAVAGSFAYLDGVRCHEPIFLGNCGVPRVSLFGLTFGSAAVMELVLISSSAVWNTS